jgi:HK97 family phage portal protein
MEQDGDGIWSETTSPAFTPVLKKPNRYQNHIQFKQHWIMSKLLHGNTYALKQRDARGMVIGQYILDPCRVNPLVSEDGSVFYQLFQDNLNGVPNEPVPVPASEIIHDRMNCLFHPLVGISPLFAAGLAATMGQSIEKGSAHFFGNGSNPSGILTAPGPISEANAKEIRENWQTNYSGKNAGRTAVLGDGMKFEPMRMTAVDAQQREILGWSDERICSAFHVPPYKVGVGAPPPYNNIEALAQEYYNTCLQILIEEMEACQDEGLGLSTKVNGRQLGYELDLDGLLRMDTATLIDTMGKGVSNALMTTDEARRRLNLKRVKGGDVIWRQQQYFSLADLADRTPEESSRQSGQQPNTPPNEPDEGQQAEQQVREFLDQIQKGLAYVD